MNIDYDLSKSSKAYLENLYNKAISKNLNRIKIFDRLQKDTDNFGYSINNQAFIKNARKNFILNFEEENELTVKNNKNEKGKKIIFKNEILEEKQMNHLNNFNERINKNNDSDFTNVLANQIRENRDNKKNKRINAFEFNHRNNKNNDINYEESIGNTSYRSKNYKKNNPQDYSNFNNNIDGSKIINNYRKNNNKERYYINNNNYEYNNTNHFNEKQEEYYNFPQKKNETKEKLIKDDIIFNNLEDKLNNNFINENSNKMNHLKGLKSNNLTEQFNNTYKRSNFNYNQTYRNENKNEFRQPPHEKDNNKNNNNYLSIPVNNNLNNRTRYRNYALETINEEINIEEEEIQNGISNRENKSNIDMFLYILLLIIGSLLLYFVLKIIFRAGNTFAEGVTQTIRVISNPKKLLRDLIWGLIKSVLIGILYDYISITLPMSIFSFAIYLYKQKRDFEALCKQIIEDIKTDLENKMDKSMSENDIINIYSKKYNINKNTFIKKHLIKLYQLRKKDHSLKISQNINDKGEKETIWELVN